MVLAMTSSTTTTSPWLLADLHGRPKRRREKIETISLLFGEYLGLWWYCRAACLWRPLPSLIIITIPVLPIGRREEKALS